MRIGIIFGKTHEGDVKIVSGPGPVDELNGEFKKFALDKEHDDFAEMFFHEIHLSGGRKRISFSAPPVETEEGESLESLDTLTIEELQQTGDDEGIDLTGCKLKQDYTDRIRAYRTLDGIKLDDLKELAKTENVDVTGCKLKADFVNTIAAHRRAANQPPA